MKNMKPRITALLLIAFATIALTGCKDLKTKNDQASINEDHKINIITTIFPLYDIASNILKDKGTVSLLLPPGLEPHSYEPTSKDLKNILSSDLFIYIGEAMEPWAHDILEGANYGGLVVEASEYVELKEAKNKDEHEDENEDEYEHEHEHSYDPHIWLDFNNNVLIAEIILDKITESILSDEKTIAYLTKNTEEYSETMKNLDSLYSETLSKCSERTFITSGHNAYNYLAEAYSLEFYSVHGLSPNSEPTPQTIKNIVQIMSERNSKYLIAETLLNPALAEAIQEETQAKILFFNPAGNISKYEREQSISFEEVMLQNLDTLKNALNCQIN